MCGWSALSLPFGWTQRKCIESESPGTVQQSETGLVMSLLAVRRISPFRARQINARDVAAHKGNDAGARHIVMSSTRGDTTLATCREEVAFLDRYLSSDLSARQRARFEKHLAVCRDCAAFLQTYKTTIELTRSFLSGTRPSRNFQFKRTTSRAKRR